MNLFKKGILFLAVLTMSVACKSDDDDNGGGASITNVDFTYEASTDGTVLSVTPTSTGGTSYSVDFGDPAVTDDSDVIATSGPAVSYDYPNETATYTVKVTASASGSESVTKEKDVVITYEGLQLLAGFEDGETLNLRGDTSGAPVVVESKTGSDGSSSKVAVASYEGNANWEAFTINPTKHINVKNKSIITVEYYQESAAARQAVLKLETAKGTDEANGIYPSVEVEISTEAVQGWQTLTFDFQGDDARNSYPNGDKAIILDQYQTIAIFIDFGSSVAGTYWFDNISGAEWGDDVPDSDEDNVIDSVDVCPDVFGTEANGCPPSTSGTDPHDDFEGNGNITTWFADDVTMDKAFANPSKTGINTSNTVLKYSDEGGQYANIRFDLSMDTSVKYDLSTKNKFKVKVFVPTPTVAHTEPKQLALKLQDGSKASPWEGQVEVIQTYVYDQWQELTFDFSAQSAATDFSRVVIQFNGENNNEHVLAYIDDITYE